MNGGRERERGWKINGSFCDMIMQKWWCVSLCSTTGSSKRNKSMLLLSVWRDWRHAVRVKRIDSSLTKSTSLSLCSCSVGKGPQCGRQRSALDVSEVPAVPGPLCAEPGEYPDRAHFTYRVSSDLMSRAYLKKKKKKSQNTKNIWLFLYHNYASQLL